MLKTGNFWRCREKERDTLLKNKSGANLSKLKNIFYKIRNKNKEPCCGLRLLYLRI